MTEEKLNTANNISRKIKYFEHMLEILSNSKTDIHERAAIGECIAEVIKPTDRIKVKQIIKTYLDAYKSEFNSL